MGAFACHLLSVLARKEEILQRLRCKVDDELHMMSLLAPQGLGNAPACLCGSWNRATSWATSWSCEQLIAYLSRISPCFDKADWIFWFLLRGAHNLHRVPLNQYCCMS